MRKLVDVGVQKQIVQYKEKNILKLTGDFKIDDALGRAALWILGRARVNARMVSVGLDECNHMAQHGPLSVRKFFSSLYQRINNTWIRILEVNITNYTHIISNANFFFCFFFLPHDSKWRPEVDYQWLHTIKSPVLLSWRQPVQLMEQVSH